MLPGLEQGKETLDSTRLAAFTRVSRQDAWPARSFTPFEMDVCLAATAAPQLSSSCSVKASARWDSI